MGGIALLHSRAASRLCFACLHTVALPVRVSMDLTLDYSMIGCDVFPPTNSFCSVASLIGSFLGHNKGARLLGRLLANADRFLDFTAGGCFSCPARPGASFLRAFADAVAAADGYPGALADDRLAELLAGARSAAAVVGAVAAVVAVHSAATRTGGRFVPKVQGDSAAVGWCRAEVRADCSAAVPLAWAGLPAADWGPAGCRDEVARRRMIGVRTTVRWTIHLGPLVRLRLGTIVGLGRRRTATRGPTIWCNTPSGIGLFPACSRLPKSSGRSDVDRR